MSFFRPVTLRMSQQLRRLLFQDTVGRLPAPVCAETCVAVAALLQVPLYERGYEKDPAKVAAEAIKVAQRDGRDVVLVDTAGRMQVQYINTFVCDVITFTFTILLLLYYDFIYIITFACVCCKHYCLTVALLHTALCSMVTCA
jgi:hypothetical protein